MKPTKTILAQSIKDVRMIHDHPDQIGRAFAIVIPGSTFQLLALTVKEAECWVRIFKIVLQMNRAGISVSDQNPFVFEKENLLTPFKMSPIKATQYLTTKSDRMFTPVSQNITYQTINIQAVNIVSKNR